MPGQYDKRRLKLDLMVACSLFAAGIVVSGMSLAQIRAETRMQTAQATQPLQGTPSDDQNKPAEAKPGGDRPTTPAPEPARPDPQTQGAAGAAKPALPPAPAEKIARRSRGSRQLVDTVIVREGGRPSIPEAARGLRRGRGVLDAPPATYAKASARLDLNLGEALA